MSRFKEKVTQLISSALGALAFPKPGIVVAFDHQNKIATVKVTSGRGRLFDLLELPWVLDTAGVYAPDPDTGTHVMVGYYGGNPDKPYIQTPYDPLWSIRTRESLKRPLVTYTTRTDTSLAM